MNRTLITAYSHVSLFVILVLFSISQLPGAQAKPVAAKGWDRDFLDDRASKNPRFMLAILSSIEGRLSGYFAFHNESLNQVILEGARTEDGQFWPVVKMQVANDRDGEWKTIGQWVNPGKLAPLVVEGTSTCKLMIDMSAFSPLVGKFKYGGVILSNGEAAWFELTDLLPPAE